METDNILETLSAPQKEVFEKFKTEIFGKEVSDEEKSWLDDRCLLRYLRARDYEIEKSTAMIWETIEWRREYRPDQIPYESVKGLQEIASLYQNGFDKQGRPILYIKPGAYNPFSAEDRVKFLVYTLEQTVARMSFQVEKMVWIMDFSNYGSRAKSPDGRQVAQNSLSVLQNHYPERLGLAFIINAPWYFTYLYKIISFFMNSVTKSKIKWINGDKDQLWEQLKEYVDKEQLEEPYGGTLPFLPK